MSLTEEYKRQFSWRDWKTALDLCPIEPGQKVLDLGCGPGDLAKELVKRGAQVTGVDANNELIFEAQKLYLNDSIFLNQDLQSLKLEQNSFDGLWCSFTAAYFRDFQSVLQKWLPLLKKKSWVCITEMDDLLGHVPLSSGFQQKLQSFYDQSFSLGRYDFRSGHKIREIVENLGFEAQEKLLSDKELAFEGPADELVLKAWSKRLNRMVGLKNFLGSDFDYFQVELLQTLADENHQSKCRVFCVIGRKEYSS